MSSTSPTRPAALAHCNTASFPQEPGSFPLDIPSPFLLGLSLLKGLFSERMDHVASTMRCSPRSAERQTIHGTAEEGMRQTCSLFTIASASCGPSPTNCAAYQEASEA